MAVTHSPSSGRPFGLRALRWLDGWTLGSLLAAAVVAAPLIAVFLLALSPQDGLWSHLVETVLWEYVGNSLILVAGVALGTLLLGVGAAWLVTMYAFPGRALFEWALLLPLAVPAYVLAFTYTELLEYAGPVQKTLRALFGWRNARDYWFPEIRSMGGAIAMLTLVLYPYVYLLTRSAFLAQSVALLEVGRTLGRGPFAVFRSVALPLARPAIVVGVALALMEALNDYGTVNYFAVRTLTLGVFNVWFGMSSLPGAAQIASVLLGFVVVLIALERLARRGRRFDNARGHFRPLPRYPLIGWRAGGAVLLCLIPILLGFLVPAVELAGFSLVHYEATLQRDFLGFVLNSVGLSAAAAAVAVGLATFLAYATRLRRNPLLRSACWVASLGYAMPGAVLAVGVIVPLTALDHAIDGAMRQWFGFGTGLLITGGVGALVFGYVARFLALSYGTMEAGLAKVTPHMDDAARSLGHRPASVLRRVHLPMVRGSALTAALLVFVDCMKELPITMILRPFNFGTLATFVYQYAGDERLEECALGALTIVLVGIGPVILLSSAIRRARPGAAEP
ncbi:MAG: ABC transporter permease [Alphaproteobacteria bacterium]